MFDDQHREFNLNFGSNPQRVDEVSDTLFYIGYGQVSSPDQSLPVWKIRRIEKNGSVWEMRYADGDELYDNIWNDRYSLNYK